jgi:hypothetical protein
MSYDYDLRHEALLLHTLKQMPKTFTSHRFTKAAEDNGCPPRTDKHNSGPHTFLHKHADIAFRGSRTWIKRPIAKVPDGFKTELESIKTELETLRAKSHNARTPKRTETPPAPRPPAPELPRAKGLNVGDPLKRLETTGFIVGFLSGFALMLLLNAIVQALG